MQFGPICIFGLVIVCIMMIPNVIYAIKFKNIENKCTNKVINLLEQIGRYASICLMILPLGVGEFAYSHVACFLLYLLGNGALLLAYLVIWVLYFRAQTKGKALALAIIPTCIFLLSGITLGHILLIISAVLFGIGHIYVTYQNNR